MTRGSAWRRRLPDLPSRESRYATRDRRPLMSANLDVAVLVGSLRRESYNRKIAKVLIELAPAAAESRDRRDPRPAALQRGRRADAAGRGRPVQAAHRRGERGPVPHAGVQPVGAGRAQERDRCRVAAVRPERLGAASRPASISVSVGAIGGFGANHHLRQSLVFLNVPTMPQPEVYIGNAASAVR